MENVILAVIIGSALVATARAIYRNAVRADETGPCRKACCARICLSLDDRTNEVNVHESRDHAG